MLSPAQLDIEIQARKANSETRWNALWTKEGDETWRKDLLKEVYDRIAHVIPTKAYVEEFGAGVGILSAKLRDEKKVVTVSYDHSDAAISACRAKGLQAYNLNLETESLPPPPSLPIANDSPTFVIATEVLEHLSEKAMRRVLKYSTNFTGAFFSVPNDDLGPEKEPQHVRQLTAKQFLDLLREYWGDACRVECLGPVMANTRAPAFLLGVCGWKKTTKLSMTMPVRDEQDDVALTLASFRAVADEIVIGIDPRSKDRTEEIARKYADVVFTIENPRGPNPEEDLIPENGVHFASIRNECIDRCTGDFIFMTEGHEHLQKGHDTLIRLSEIVKQNPGVKVGYVWRTGNGERWAYPWLFANDSRLRFVRSTHNQLEIPGGVLEIRLPQVETRHRRSHNNAVNRTQQRRVQNRKTLLDDWSRNGNTTSLYYLASESREVSLPKGIARMEEFLASPSKNGPARYQIRIYLSKDLITEPTRDYECRLKELQEKTKQDGVVDQPVFERLEIEHQKAMQAAYRKARAVLIRATEDDWSRTEHFLRLGDLAFEQEQLEEALHWYRLSATTIGHPPFTLWWIDEDFYSYLPAQRLVMIYCALGKIEDALPWAKKAAELLPDDAPEAVREESLDILKEIESFLSEDHAEALDVESLGLPIETKRVPETVGAIEADTAKDEDEK